MTDDEHITRYLLKTIFLKNHNLHFCIFAPEGPREKNHTPKCSQWPHLLGWWQPPQKRHTTKNFWPSRPFSIDFSSNFTPGSKKKKKKKKKKKSCHPYILTSWSVVYDPRPPPTPPTLFGGPLCERTERDRDMKISGFVYLDTADALKYVRIWSEDLKGPLRP